LETRGENNEFEIDVLKSDKNDDKNDDKNNILCTNFEHINTDRIPLGLDLDPQSLDFENINNGKRGPFIRKESINGVNHQNNDNSIKNSNNNNNSGQNYHFSLPENKRNSQKINFPKNCENNPTNLQNNTNNIPKSTTLPGTLHPPIQNRSSNDNIRNILHTTSSVPHIVSHNDQPTQTPQPSHALPQATFTHTATPQRQQQQQQQQQQLIRSRSIERRTNNQPNNSFSLKSIITDPFLLAFLPIPLFCLLPSLLLLPILLFAVATPLVSITMVHFSRGAFISTPILIILWILFSLRWSPFLYFYAISNHIHISSLLLYFPHSILSFSIFSPFSVFTFLIPSLDWFSQAPSLVLQQPTPQISVWDTVIKSFNITTVFIFVFLVDFFLHLATTMAHHALFSLSHIEYIFDIDYATMMPFHCSKRRRLYGKQRKSQNFSTKTKRSAQNDDKNRDKKEENNDENVPFSEFLFLFPKETFHYPIQRFIRLYLHPIVTLFVRHYIIIVYYAMHFGMKLSSFQFLTLLSLFFKKHKDKFSIFSFFYLISTGIQKLEIYFGKVVTQPLCPTPVNPTAPQMSSGPYTFSPESYESGVSNGDRNNPNNYDSQNNDQHDDDAQKECPFYASHPKNKPTSVSITSTTIDQATKHVCVSPLQKCKNCTNCKTDHYQTSQLQDSNGNDESSPECGICFSRIPNLLRLVTPCKHNFHLSCLLNWYSQCQQAKCPLCRTFTPQINLMDMKCEGCNTVV
jgi:hypothetical protein